MTIIYADGFDSVNNKTDLERRWTVPGTDTLTYGNVGRNGVGRRLTVAVGVEFLSRGLWARKTGHIYAGFAYRRDNWGSSITHQDVFNLIESGSLQCSLSHPAGSGGQLAFYRRPGAGTNILLGSASARVLRADVWYYIEVKMKVTSTLTTGDLELRVNGETWITVDSGSTSNTGNDWCEAFRFGQANAWGTANVDFDDFYILDSAGPAPYNTFLGDIRVDTIRPNGNGTTSDFVGSDADSVDNYLLVDEVTPDYDTSYLKSSTANEIDLHALTSLPVTPSVIFGVQPVAVCKKTDAGVRTARHVIRTGGTNYESGADIYPSSKEYLGFASLGGAGMWEDNPNTLVPFVEADIDALESGIKIQT